MLRGSLDWTWGTKGQFIRPRCIEAVGSRTLDISILILMTRFHQDRNSKHTHTTDDHDIRPRITQEHNERIRRAQVKVGLINLHKGLFSLNARIYYKLKSGT